MEQNNQDKKNNTNFIVMYGYNNKLLHHWLTRDNHCTYKIIVIEPRKDYIDTFRRDVSNVNNVFFIPKALSNKSTEIVLYDNGFEYFLHTNTLDTRNKSEYETTYSKQKVYTTTLQTVFETYNLQYVYRLVFDINVNNCNDILNNIINPQLTITYIDISKNNNFIDWNKIAWSNYFLPESSKNTLIDLDSFVVFKLCQPHTGKDFQRPKIGMYFLTQRDKTLSSYSLKSFIKQHDITTLPVNNSDKIATYSLPKKLYHQEITDALACVFKEVVNIDTYDILCQINENYIHKFSPFRIHFPIPEKVIYMDKNTDTIYASKNGMFLLFDTLISQDFYEYMQKQKNKNPKIFTLFNKMYFLNYISKIFQIKHLQND